MPQQKENHVFKVGDKAKLQKLDFFPEFNGRECLIVGELRPRDCTNPDTFEVFLDNRWRIVVIGQDGKYLNARPDQLVPPVEPPLMQRLLEAVLG